MTITKHAIQRFQERVTPESSDFVRSFIEADIRSGMSLYRANNVEKIVCNGIVYVLDCTEASNFKVLTVYLSA